MLVADFITGGFSIINKLIEVHKLNEWAKLVFGFAFTFVTSFSSACGASLLHGDGRNIAVGWGLVSASGSCWALFVLNPRTRGIMVAQRKDLIADTSAYQATEKK